MTYQILSSERPTDLTTKVNEALKNGWSLHGPTTVSSAGSNIVYVQAVTQPTPDAERPAFQPDIGQSPGL
jgi:hypothetical protein